MQVILPETFTDKHEQALTTYLSDDRLLDEAGWRQLFQGIDLLEQAEVVIDQDHQTFRQIYREQIDHRLADLYIEQLLAVGDVQRQSPVLAATFARQIQPFLERSGLLRRGITESRLLLAYCLFWWQSFARGYAFEVEVLRDLEASGIDFQAHNIRDRAERYSPADLVVLDLLGDIKASTYFLQFQPAGELPNDFYITRMYERGQERTLVVFQRPAAWDKIDGETVAGELDDILVLLPQPVQLQRGGLALIVVEYEFWKQKVLLRQQDIGR